MTIKGGVYKLFFAILAAAAFAVSVMAQQPPKEEPKYTEIKYSADKSSYRWEGEDRVLVLKGAVKFVQGDTVLLADTVDYRESTRTAKAFGNLKIYDEQSTVTGEACLVDFKEKKGTLTGDARLVARPNPKSKKLDSEWKDEITITCDKIEYFYKDKKAVVSSPLKMVQKTRTITADSATYFGREEVVHLAGNVKGNDSKDRHSFSAPKVVISLKDNDEWIEAEKATGTFYVKDEAEEEEPAPAPAGEESKSEQN